MSTQYDFPEREADPVESFIGESLPFFQSKWLLTQSNALGQPRSILFEEILREWFASRDAETWSRKGEAQIARQAG